MLYRGELRCGKSIRGAAALVACVVGAALAQQPPDDVRGAITVDVTGSHIPRSEAESALPVQVLTRGDIQRTGATTALELMGKVSANILGANDQLAVVNRASGLASANLRGIGDGSTLVLLNGRRAANYAFDGGTVDLNTIPLAAIERVEILKDGASAIYGADAIAGVVNFILRKDFHGIELTGYGAWTEHGGADSRLATATFGFGDLARDRFNAFATVSYQKEDALRASERPFSRTSYIPSEGISYLGPPTFPANIQVAPGSLVNPTLAAGCAPPVSIPTQDPFISTTPYCGYNMASAVNALPPVERVDMVARATLQVDASNQLFAEATYAHNQFTFTSPPVPVLDITTGAPVLYPAGGPYYPIEFAAANGIAGDLDLFYRPVQLGPRTSGTDSKALRALVGAEGFTWGWNYGAALTYNENRQSENLVSGYVSTQRILAALATGLINPFGRSTAEGDALLATTQIVGALHQGKGTTLAFDIRASKQVSQLPGGSLAIALGAEARREQLDNVFAPVWTSGDITGGGGDQSVGGSRTAGAVFIEASIPVVKGFEAQLAVRYDHYSDFGGTTNPKIALRWQPVTELLLRTSWGTGFRAPALYDLYSPVSYGFVSGAGLQDPLRCPTTGLPSDCGYYYESAYGGNRGLKPEQSEQVNAGAVWEPIAGLSLNLDYWKINKRGVIGSLNETTVFDQLGRYAPTNIVRGPVAPDFPSLPGPIEVVLLTNQNLGDLRTSGIDVGGQWRSPTTTFGALRFGFDGTYVLTWQQQFDGVSYVSALGQNGFDIDMVGPVPRWKHYATVDWELGPWGATLAQNFQCGYVDANVDRAGNPLPVPPRRVGTYEIWDLQGRYSGFDKVTVVLGVKNLMDRAPPFTNQPYAFQASSFQVGFNPAYADPRGRTFYAQISFALN
jgi:iron complex outermembrane receptor protein